jgi:2-polyprenyl-3-methyl-5-hydroxy-6-metoxy-1,4-benzoquinol methylase
LDYGCGSGLLLKVASEHGFTNNVGTDISDSALDLAIAINNKTSNIFKNINENLGEQIFDIITFIDSIGHIENVKAVLTSLSVNNMHNNTLLIIRTPLINNYYLRYAGILMTFFPKKYCKHLYFTTTRYILFNERSIKIFLESLGFQILYLKRQMDYKNKSNFKSLKVLLSHIVFQIIPRIINRENSMIIVAKRKVNSSPS